MVGCESLRAGVQAIYVVVEFDKTPNLANLPVYGPLSKQNNLTREQVKHARLGNIRRKCACGAAVLRRILRRVKMSYGVKISVTLMQVIVTVLNDVVRKPCLMPCSP